MTRQVQPTILFINRVYPPDTAATAVMLAELAEGLVEKGWRVTVLTSRTTEVRRETIGGVQVVRVSGLAFGRSGHGRRLLSYLSRYPAFLWHGVKLGRRTDFVVTMTDPPLLLLIGPVIRWLGGGRLLHWTQDLYPEVAERLGVLGENGLAAGFFRALSNWGLRRCAAIICISPCMRDRLVQRGLPRERLTVIPNWADAARIYPITHDQNPFRRDHKFGERFVVMYSGNMGLSHPFGKIVDAAEQLQERKSEIVFAFVGDGPRLHWIRSEATRRKLTNVSFLPMQPREGLAESLSAADLHLITLQPDLVGLLVPSKIYGIMAAGRPSIFLGPENSEVAALIHRHRCGTVVSASSDGWLAREIEDWYNSPGRRHEAGLRARRAAVETSAEHAIERFAELFGSIMVNGRPKVAS